MLPIENIGSQRKKFRCVRKRVCVKMRSEEDWRGRCFFNCIAGCSWAWFGLLCGGRILGFGGQAAADPSTAPAVRVPSDRGRAKSVWRDRKTNWYLQSLTHAQCIHSIAFINIKCSRYEWVLH
ncbi:hypothetical protein FOTG_00492 [Fusarium oxysporum f. sp. vasinfectum 25433]|uniref:Uncharacterized protein n=1 Tax=Fusarium oxysporum f. sp. vasinfectum 25433 TaxID=1089449 RepID=X0MRG5_FUSOX|nr:hypothetical protein FOTG_00492 [Fusarium oxysporum f. sp. vasinfectum 25433]